MRPIFVKTKEWDQKDLSLGQHHQPWASTALQNPHTVEFQMLAMCGAGLACGEKKEVLSSSRRQTLVNAKQCRAKLPSLMRLASICLTVSVQASGTSSTDRVWGLGWLDQSVNNRV